MFKAKKEFEEMKCESKSFIFISKLIVKAQDDSNEYA